jgi:hypothetical protein
LWEDTGGKGVGAEKSSTSLIESKRGKERKKTSGRFERNQLYIIQANHG